MLFPNVNNLDQNVCSASIARSLTSAPCTSREKKRTQCHNGEMPCDLLDFDKIPPNILNSCRDTQPVYFIWSLLSLRHPYTHSTIFPFFVSKFHGLRTHIFSICPLVVCLLKCMYNVYGEVMWMRACEMRSHNRAAHLHTWHIDNLLNKTDFITQSFNLSGIIPCYVICDCACVKCVYE